MAELAEFLSNIKLLTSTLGHKIFESVIETIDITTNQDNIFYCKNSNGIVAKGSPSTEGFMVYQGSRFVLSHQSSLTESIRIERIKLIHENTLVQEGDCYKLLKDYAFGSSSRAAAMVLGRSARGPVEWKTEKGIQLNQAEL